ncbi:MAG: hypothetical protein HRT38_05415 [Alteromonadaceae bacterium]|nr:hypothetical protein [Alteromonadaceae bacterium]
MSEEKSKEQNNVPLTRDEQHDVRAIINTWKKKLTWDLLVDKILSQLKIKISRQSLSNPKVYKAINDDYHAKKAELRGITPEIAKRVTMSDVAMLEKIERLEAKVKIKDDTIEKQLVLIKVMLANASEIPNYDITNITKPRND